MRLDDPNVELLARMADALGDVCDQLVFVGGCATALLLSDPAAAGVRVTSDVDAVVSLASLPDYQRLGDSLRAKGFTQTMEEGDPPYRWRIAGMALDVMPVDEAVLGFTNRWYEATLRTASEVQLSATLAIRLVSPACFLATKLEAFMDRGQGDYMMSHDLEDVLTVIDGRPEIVDDLAAADALLRSYVAGVISRLLADEGFVNALPGMIIDGGVATRLPVVLDRLGRMALLKE
jgi:predicted nucleotidyltransferase